VVLKIHLYIKKVKPSLCAGLPISYARVYMCAFKIITGGDNRDLEQN
jgi:hypothetical protein